MAASISDSHNEPLEVFLSGPSESTRNLGVNAAKIKN